MDIACLQYFFFILANGADFLDPATFEVTFPGGATVDDNISCIEITIVDDLQFEGREQLFHVNITGTNLPNVICTTDCTAVIQVMDDASDSKYMRLLLKTKYLYHATT